MTIIDIPNDYSVQLSPPDITSYKDGNIGIDYIWSFDSGRPGPHACITAVVHGNELCGAIALDWLLSSEFRPIAGTVSFGFMNVAAFEAFDPEDPNASRWVEEDFNRVWAEAVLDGDRESVELRRARAVRPFLDTVDFLLDIHSMQHPAPPLMMSGRHDKARELAARIGAPERVVADSGHAAGKRMRDYAGFDDPASDKAALLIECGQHWAADTVPLAKLASARFLTSLGVADLDLLQGLGEPGPQLFYRVTEAVTIESDGFKFAQSFTGGEVLPKAGTLIGTDGDRPVVTPYDDCMLVMPTKRTWKGQTAVRLARLDA
ncbi:MAG: M14 family metallopeptidase [Alphaproteobacteria bacterium]|nr:M14 family metallopeptidase [Alphaproteobacteria bacterium]